MSGTLTEAESIRGAHPDVASGSIFAAAAAGDEAKVRHFLKADPKAASKKGGPYEWDALTYLCFSRYLRLDRGRSEAFVGAARALLDAGADPNTGWMERDHTSRPVWESAVYGAAGVAHHPGVTALLLERGADPNDEETPYHAPETGDLAALRVLVESGRLTADSLATMLLRKADWHDGEGVKYLLAHGAGPNRMTIWGYTALHQALRRDNRLETVDALLRAGADPVIKSRDGLTAIQIAARRGRGDVLALLDSMGIRVELSGVDRLIAACARDDAAAVRAIAATEPRCVAEAVASGGTLLAEFAGNANAAGVGHLLDVGVAVGAVYPHGDGYFDVAPGSTSLHVAAWRAAHNVARLLIKRGAPVNVGDGLGRTPLQLAVRACVDSYWSHRRSPESVAALLGAGASQEGIVIPTGYDEIDQLLSTAP